MRYCIQMSFPGSSGSMYCHRLRDRGRRGCSRTFVAADAWSSLSYDAAYSRACTLQVWGRSVNPRCQVRVVEREG